MKYKAVGIHVFAGGFTMGVQKVMNVDVQLEAHGPFGQRTAKEVCNVEWVNSPSGEWPDVDAHFAYGNPRCTGFSTITSGYDSTAHGPWSKPTADIHQLCEYAAGRYDAVIWESVQQAYTVGKPLLDHLRDNIFIPKCYRIAHIFLNAASFGNCQQRKRYFFVAYRNDRNFNITPPNFNPFYKVLHDVIGQDTDRDVNVLDTARSDEYDRDTHYPLTKNEWACVPHLPNGWDLNCLAKHNTSVLPQKMQRKYKLRISDMPFSMHGIVRLNWLRPSPTLHSSCARFIHPEHHRPLTIGELSRIMGWGDRIPSGKQPAAQLAKGVAPSAGEWLAQQVQSYLDNEWGNEDWESTYCPIDCEWKGQNTNGAMEKVFDLTKYTPSHFDMERHIGISARHKHNIDPTTGKNIKPWRKVVDAYYNSNT